MRIGKVKESIWKRSVCRQLHNKNEQNLPVSLHVFGVQGWTLAPQRVIWGSLNAMAECRDIALRLSVWMPPGTEEASLKQLIREADALAAKARVSLTVEQVSLSPFAATLLVSAAAVGEEKKLHTPKPHQDLVVAGTVGREGAAMLACEKENALRSRYAASYIETAKHLFDDGDMRDAAAAAEAAGAGPIYPLSEGGIFAGLWELAAAGKVGLDVALKQIPMKQHTIEVCEFFRLNPYMLFSGGSLLMACDNGEKVVRALREKGITAGIIGRTTDSNDKLIRYDDEVRYLEPPKEDEYYKVIAGGNYA